MTEQPDFPARDSSHPMSDRAMGLARIEYAELLFHEAPDVGGASQPSSELTAQVQASVFLAIYYELRHGHDQLTAHARALDQHRAAMAELTTAYRTAELMGVQNGLPPAREPVD
jgi:hypothetical protein